MTELQYAQVKVRDAYRCTKCGAPTQEGAWHHRRGKAVRDDHTHCSCNGVWLCHDCHRKVHADGLRSRINGFIVSRIRKAMPYETPIRTMQYGWVLLDCEGKYEPTVAPSEED